MPSRSFHLDPAPIVTVAQAEACLDADALGEELRGVLPPGARVEVRVEAVGDERIVDLRVLHASRELWSTRLSLLVGDCPASPAFLAASTRTALAPLGRFEGSGRATHWVVALGLPLRANAGIGDTLDLRLGVGAELVVDTGPARGLLGAGLAAGPPVVVGSGAAQLLRLDLDAGWTGGLAGAGSPLLAAAGASVGLAAAWGNGLARDRLGVAPSAGIWTRAGVATGPAMDASLELRLALTRVQLEATGAGATPEAWLEPWARVGLVLRPTWRVHDADPE